MTMKMGRRRRSSTCSRCCSSVNNEDDPESQKLLSSSSSTDSVTTCHRNVQQSNDPTPIHRHSNNPPEISLRLVLPLLFILEQKHGSEKVNSIVTEVGETMGISNLSYYSLKGSADDVWVSFRFVDEIRNLIFYQLYNMEELPPRSHPLWQLWRQAGIVAFQKEGLGSVVFGMLKAFLSPGVLYRNLPSCIRRGNTVLNCSILSSSVGMVEVSMKPKHPKTYKEGHEYCLNRIGVLEAIPMIWGLKMARVEHTRCMHDPVNPSDECRYVVRYEERWLLGIAKSVLMIAICIYLPVHYMISSSWEISLAVGLISFLAMEGWRRYLALNHLYQHDRKHMRHIIDLYDKRYMDLWNESEQLRRLTLDNRNISAYVPPPLLDRLRGRREQVPRLGGSKREATIVFVDIRNYSTMAEKLDPEETLNVLNVCFSAWVKDVQSHGGTVLEFLGDGMLAVFGAPNDIVDHPAQAVKCLQTMTQTMERLNETWEVTGGITKNTSLTNSKLGFRGGVHTGTVIAGNLGSATQMKYAVVGDTVNVAARLEQLNKSLGTIIAVSGDTYSHLPKDLKKWVKPKGHHFVKGRDQAVEVYAYGNIPLIGPGGSKHRRLSAR